jgi:ankyrin repeat protein
LAKCGADVNERGTITHNGKSLSATPFGYAAVILGDLPLAQALLQAGGDVNRTINSVDGEVRFPPLTMALSMRRFEAAHFLIEHGANLEAAGPRFGNTPLIEAIAASNELSRRDQAAMLTLARKLLGSGAKINARNALDMTALHFAASAGNVPAIQLLLSYGADPLALDNQRNSPLFYAKRAKANEAIKLLDLSRQTGGERRFP